MIHSNTDCIVTNIRTLDDSNPGFASEFYRNILAIPAKEGSNIHILEPHGADDDVSDELERISDAIESAAATIKTLNETISAYEMTIFDLTAQVAELSIRQNAYIEQTAKAEAKVLAEIARAEAAEARARTSEERLSNLERRQLATKERLGRVTTAVSNLVAAGDDQKSAPFAMAS
jgi:chromosome segregation ATPase